MQPDDLRADYEQKRSEVRNLLQKKAERERRLLIDELIFNLEHPEPTLATGLSRLDDLLDGGLRPGEVFVLAARPRIGKSAFALQLALHAAGKGSAVSIWSLEMRPKQWARRAIAALSGVSPKKLRRGGDYLTPDEIGRASVAMGKFKNLPVSFANTDNTDPEGFAKQADEQVEYAGAELLIIDYLQLMDSPKGASSREQEVAQLSRSIKKTANSLAVPIILLAQLNRNAEGKVPTLADLRESGAVEQDADEVFFLHRDTNPETHVLENFGLGVLAKNRDGEGGMVKLTYNWRSYSFAELP